MAKLNLEHPLSPDQALLHIATGTSKFVGAVDGRPKLTATREWLAEDADAPAPSTNARNRDRLKQLRAALDKVLEGGDGYNLKGWVWLWFAKSSCPAAVHPACARNWSSFLTERSAGSQGAAVVVSPEAAKKNELRQRYDLEKLANNEFDLALALLLGRLGKVTPILPASQPVAAWRSTGLEPEMRLALEKLARSRPDLLADADLGKPYRCDRLDRFDLFVALCKAHRRMADVRYSGVTLLKCLQTLVATRRGRRPSSHPFEAPNADGLFRYVKKVASHKEWLSSVYFRRR